MNRTNQNLILYTSKDKKIKVELYEFKEQIWLSQNQIAQIFDTSKSSVSEHISNILNDGELKEISVVRNFRTTASDGKEYNTKFYSLDMVLAIGFRVRSKRGVEFRIWANENLREFLQKGFLIDSDRLKNPNGRSDYFDELLEQIRDIRASEKRFYQKVRDLFALCSDYDSADRATQMFFANTQNKLLYAVTKHTAAEIIMQRASQNKPNFGLTSWKGNIVRKGDIFTAKNYLNKDELDSLNRLVSVFLDSAEIRVKEHKMLTMDFWKQNIDDLLKFAGKEILSGNGSVTNEKMQSEVSAKYEIFNQKRKVDDAKIADDEDIKMLENVYKEIKG